MNLPEAVTASSQTQVNLTLTITPEGDLFLEDEAIALTDLADKVRSLSPSAPVSVTIRADRATAHGTVVTAMDKLRTVENIRLSIATAQP